jgi:hypothetical protein
MLPNWMEWAERADACAQPDTVERVRADIALAAGRSVRGQPAEAIALWAHALATAREQNDPAATLEAGYRLLIWQRS